ncbi:hypothetical protein ESCO_000954 [Escovopsis weberi]|uniref:Basic proline-rich protein n=1 Tax=Escovopsis weberi TaxID=150374 RepID=A0A0N0RTE8_ESCWE|nr:hypothetical protein ESCO_000954 [Escovopsis weberi]
MRRSTDPSPTSTTPPSVFSWGPMATLPYRPRTASPLSGTHTRSRSVASLGAPAMGRTQSMPGLNGSGHIFFSPQFRPTSPANSPSRVRTPRKHIEEAFPLSSPIRNSILDQDGPPPSSRSSSPILGVSANASRLRRPSSPLRNYAQSTGSLTILPSTPSSSSSSLYRAYDPFSSSYSNYSAGAFSSVPSTPTSARSRSPSISSLETIPDSPDAEEAAVEAEKAAQLKAAAEISASSDSADGKGRGSLDPLNRGRTMTYGSREKRKRWSVCGAERRGDLDLETIWED